MLSRRHQPADIKVNIKQELNEEIKTEPSLNCCAINESDNNPLVITEDCCMDAAIKRSPEPRGLDDEPRPGPSGIKTEAKPSFPSHSTQNRMLDSSDDESGDDDYIRRSAAWRLNYPQPKIELDISPIIVDSSSNPAVAESRTSHIESGIELLAAPDLQLDWLTDSSDDTVEYVPQYVAPAPVVVHSDPLKIEPSSPSTPPIDLTRESDEEDLPEASDRIPAPRPRLAISNDMGRALYDVYHQSTRSPNSARVLFPTIGYVRCMYPEKLVRCSYLFNRQNVISQLLNVCIFPYSGSSSSPRLENLVAAENPIRHVIPQAPQLMPAQNTMPVISRPPPLRSSLYPGNGFTIQRAGSESQFPWFNQQNINHPEPPAYSAQQNLRMLLSQQPRPFNAPVSPSQSTLNWSAPPYYPRSSPVVIAISPPLPNIPVQQVIPIAGDQPLSLSPPPPIPSSISLQTHRGNTNVPANHRLSDPAMHANPQEGIQRPTAQQNGHSWPFRNQPQPRCPFLSTDRNRRYATSNHQHMYHNHPHQNSNVPHVRPAYAPHEILWHRQQNNQEMHRRHMMHTANAEGAGATNQPHNHHPTNNVRILGTNNQGPAFCLSCDQQHYPLPIPNRRVRSYMCPFPVVS